MAGPAMPVICIRLVDHLAAFSKSASGTSKGAMARWAGQPRRRKDESKKSSQYIEWTGIWYQLKAAKASEQRVAPARLSIISLRRSKTSARYPAGSVKSSMGMAWTRPTMPRERAWPVRSYTSQPMAKPWAAVPIRTSEEAMR